MATTPKLFQAPRVSKKATPSTPGNIIPHTVRFLGQAGAKGKKPPRVRVLSQDEKMLCALRRVLAKMSESDGGVRYFIASPVEVMQRTGGTGLKPGEPGSYGAQGKFTLGGVHAEGHSSHRAVKFSIHFKDTKNHYGQPDVAYVDPTSIDAA